MRFCEMCDLAIEENVKHLVMQCPFYEIYRSEMLRGLEVEYVNVILENPQELFVSLMGKHPENVESMLVRHAFCLYSADI